MELPKVSIIIPAYNEEKVIGKCLNSIGKTNYPKKKLETIVVDDGSTDDTAKITSKFNVKLIRGKHGGMGYAKNLGLKKASGDIIIFIDADETITKNFIKEVVKPYKDQNVVGVDFSHRLVNKNSSIARLHFLRHALGIEYYDLPFALSFRKKTAFEMGRVKQQFGYYDDWDFMMRIKKKGKIVRAKKAIFGRIEPENINEIWRQNKWAGKSMINMFRGYKKETLEKLLFPLICAPVPLYILFLFLPGFFRIIGIIGILPFLILQAQRVYRMYKISKWKESFLSPFFDIFTMSLFLLGVLIGLLNSESTPKA